MKFFSVSHKTELASCHNSCVILMTMLPCKIEKLHHSLTVRNFECTINKKSHNLGYNSSIIGTRDFDSSVTDCC